MSRNSKILGAICAALIVALAWCFFGGSASAQTARGLGIAGASSGSTSTANSTSSIAASVGRYTRLAICPPPTTATRIIRMSLMSAKLSRPVLSVSPGGRIADSAADWGNGSEHFLHLPAPLYDILKCKAAGAMS